jgi:dephospho-CoA kinase
VWFRDWLRAHPEDRQRYEDTKRELSVLNVGKPDYDDYTRAKTAYFDDVQSAFVTWARTTAADRCSDTL